MAQKSRGFFIVFEGGEGTGKTTQIRFLANWLRKQGHRVRVTKEPGGTAIGLKIRRILLSVKNHRLSPLAELFLYEADRAQHINEVVAPLLKQNTIVISDRHADSSTVYQGYCRQLGVSTVRKLNAIATKELIPGVTVVLDAAVAVARKRLMGRRALDRMEREALRFHHRVRQGFLMLAKKTPKRYLVVDATKEKSEVQQVIRIHVEKQLK